MPSLRPQFVLFGDSITQKAFGSGGWASYLADAYQRRADIINRGYSGYNTKWALKIIDHVFPTKATSTNGCHLVTIFFGANDAALADRTSSAQHVPLPEYISNMKGIIHHIKSQSVDSRIILITPPPIYESGRLAHVLATYNVTLDAPERTNEHTGIYADAVVALGKELNLPVLNLYQQFQTVDGWQTVLLNDGLHLTPEGNQLVGRLLLQCIMDNYKKNLDPDTMKWDVPDWTTLRDSDNVAEAVTRHLEQRTQTE